jgi:hypothetical protein
LGEGKVLGEGGVENTGQSVPEASKPADVVSRLAGVQRRAGHAIARFEAGPVGKFGPRLDAHDLGRLGQSEASG